MITKFFEVRDSMTFIPVMALKFDALSDAEAWLVSQGGYGQDRIEQRGYVLLVRLGDGNLEIQYSPYSWRGSRTLVEAHKFILDNFDALDSGNVVDVEFILGHRVEPKISQREG